MRKFKFARSESWSAGWRGKQSETPIKLGSYEVGVIRGEENAAISGSMNYTIKANGERVFGHAHGRLTEAKAEVSAVLPRFLVGREADQYYIIDSYGVRGDLVYERFQGRKHQAVQEVLTLNAQAESEEGVK